MPGGRVFRGDESHDAEQLTRARVADVLQSRGITVLSDERVDNGQTIVAELPSGERIKMRVRLSWRTGGARGPRAHSAVQLISSLGGSEREQALRRKFESERRRGFTHSLFVQREESRIVRIALVPLSDVVPLWRTQWVAYDDLIRAGMNGRRFANPADNGHSPSLWLRDDRAPGAAAAVAGALWSHPRVVDVTALPRVSAAGRGAGYGDPAGNREVEDAAVAAVRLSYERDGWTVSSRERDCCGYDLECTRDRAVEHVEVKGVRGMVHSFMITAGEVEQARIDPCFVLIVVTSALSHDPELTRYSGVEFIERFELKAVQYRASLMRT